MDCHIKSQKMSQTMSQTMGQTMGFIKAFKMYEPAASDFEVEGDENQDVTFTNIGELLSTDPEGQFSLPLHLRCTSHTQPNFKYDVDKWMTISR